MARRVKPLEYVAKPATLALLTGVALVLSPENETRRTWFVIALVLSLAGDVFLMLPRDLFVAGLASFLLAHVAYIAGFGLDDAWPAIVVVAVLVVPIAVPILRALVAQRERGLVGPVVAYMAVITLMGACAVGSGNVVAAVGAILFMASDSLIAWNRFVDPKPWAPVAIIVLYHLGQLGLVVSLLR